MSVISRRTLLGVAAAGLAATVTGCASGQTASSGGGAGKQVSISYEMWGTPEKAGLVQKAIEAFHAKNPDIRVKVEASPWAGYWEKLATKAAGGNAPEVMHMSERYILEYGQRGALAEIESLKGIDLKGLAEDVVALGRNPEGKLYALPAGLNTLSLGVNEDALKQAGIELPDDTKWTWDDYYALSKKASEAGLTGSNYGFSLETLIAWTRQVGETVYSKDGKDVGFTPATLKAYLEHMLKIKANGGETPDAAAENATLPLKAQPSGQGKQAMMWTYSNQLGESAKGTGAQMKMLLYPSHVGDAKKNGMFYKGSEFFSISAKASPEKQEAAAKFVNFMANDPDAVAAVGLSMGVPPNTKLVEALRPSMTPHDQRVMDFIGGLGKYISTTSPGPSPKGAGNIEGLLGSDVLDVLNGRLTVDAAVTKLTESMKRELNA